MRATGRRLHSPCASGGPGGHENCIGSLVGRYRRRPSAADEPAQRRGHGYAAAALPSESDQWMAPARRFSLSLSLSLSVCVCLSLVNSTRQSGAVVVIRVNSSRRGGRAFDSLSRRCEARRLSIEIARRLLGPIAPTLTCDVSRIA